MSVKGSSFRFKRVAFGHGLVMVSVKVKSAVTRTYSPLDPRKVNVYTPGEYFAISVVLNTV